MSNQSNQDAGLQDLSRVMGWDPTKIDGQDFPLLAFDEAEQIQGFRPGPAPPDPQGAPRNIPVPKVEGL